MYLQVQDENETVIAIVKAKTGLTGIIKNSKKVKKLVALAVKEEWIYDSVKLCDWNYNECNNQMTFNCVKDGAEDVRVIDLIITTLYK